MLSVVQDVENARGAVLRGVSSGWVEETLPTCCVGSDEGGEACRADGFGSEKLNEQVGRCKRVRQETVGTGFGVVSTADEGANPGTS
jgi:hypothetical protein